MGIEEDVGRSADRSKCLNLIRTKGLENPGLPIARSVFDRHAFRVVEEEGNPRGFLSSVDEGKQRFADQQEKEEKTCGAKDCQRDRKAPGNRRDSDTVRSQRDEDCQESGENEQQTMERYREMDLRHGLT